MLFCKECKKVIFSLTFVLYVVTVVAMYVTQFYNDRAYVEAPRLESGDYGTTLRESPELIMPAAVESLLGDYLSGSYPAYPIMFYKDVKLKENKRLEMRAILEELTGLSGEEIDGFNDFREEGFYSEGLDENGYPIINHQEMVLPEYTLPESLTYERFCELMDRADKLIGGGSSYSVKTLASYFGRAPMTYEEALEEYQAVMQPRELGSAYLRLHCDYMGIDLAVMPVFVAAALWQQDKRARMQALIYTRKSSALRIVGTRYLALVCCMAVPVLLTLLYTIFMVNGMYPQMHIAWGGGLGMALLWLLADILAVSAVGALLTELLSPMLAIFLQCAWWFLSLNATALTGNVKKFGLQVRHNSLEKIALWQSQWDNFVCNRMLLIALAALCLALTIWLYERKRRGGMSWINHILSYSISGKSHDDKKGKKG
ncbi:MAG: ABC transporter permease [Lachnospiraceae bacterium]|nr:ABC transporter permease [Lachnospiraceae bacterium]